MTNDPVLNAMTVDVEEYFQVSAFESRVSRGDWERCESRVIDSTVRLLAIFDQTNVKATFFVLGWIADRHPGLVRRIAANGHELASHGYDHRLVYTMSAEQFRNDLRRARWAIEQASGVRVLGYRAPSFSITRQSLWALDVLIEEGYLYDCSIYPIHHDRYGIPDWDRHIDRVHRAGGAIWELPGSTVRWAGANLPVAGGGYFRLLPYALTRRGIRTVNGAEHQSAVFYIHPWEIDPDQPRLPCSAATRLRHYANLGRTESRLRRLLSEFSFGTASQVVERAAARRPVASVVSRVESPWTAPPTGHRSAAYRQ